VSVVSVVYMLSVMRVVSAIFESLIYTVLGSCECCECGVNVVNIVSATFESLIYTTLGSFECCECGVYVVRVVSVCVCERECTAVYTAVL